MQAAKHFSLRFSFWSDFFFCPWLILFLPHFATAPQHSLAALTLGYLSLWKNPLNPKHFQWWDLGLLLFSHQSFPIRCCWKEQGKKFFSFRDSPKYSKPPPRLHLAGYFPSSQPFSLLLEAHQEFCVLFWGRTINCKQHLFLSAWKRNEFKSCPSSSLHNPDIFPWGKLFLVPSHQILQHPCSLKSIFLLPIKLPWRHRIWLCLP